jgi:hypothetical protein
MTKFADLIKQLDEVVPLQVSMGAGHDREDFTDFPYIEDPEAYVTHRPYEDPYGKPFSNEAELLEQEDEEEPPPEAAGGAEEAPPEGQPPEGGEEPPPEEEEPLDVDQAVGEQKLSASEIGRVYELKKIYSRLVAIEQYLATSVNTNLLELRNKVSQSLSLFEIVIDNFESYKEKVDEIIVNYYKFIKLTYNTLREHYKQEAKREI